jgi:hypothetical protein
MPGKPVATNGWIISPPRKVSEGVKAPYGVLWACARDHTVIRVVTWDLVELFTKHEKTQCLALRGGYLAKVQKPFRNWIKDAGITEDKLVVEDVEIIIGKRGSMAAESAAGVYPVNFTRIGDSGIWTGAPPKRPPGALYTSVEMGGGLGSFTQAGSFLSTRNMCCLC